MVLTVKLQKNAFLCEVPIFLTVNRQISFRSDGHG